MMTFRAAMFNAARAALDQGFVPMVTWRAGRPTGLCIGETLQPDPGRTKQIRAALTEVERACSIGPRA